MFSLFIELRTPLFVNQPGRRIGKTTGQVSMCRYPLRLEEHRPAGAGAFERRVETGSQGNQLGLGRTFKLRTAIGKRALNATVLVEHDAWRDERGPGQTISEAGGAGFVFGKV